MAVWWATPIEMRSAIERLKRMGQLTRAEYVAAGTRLEMLRRTWREVQPNSTLRSAAEGFLTQHALKAADEALYRAKKGGRDQLLLAA